MNLESWKAGTEVCPAIAATKADKALVAVRMESHTLAEMSLERFKTAQEAEESGIAVALEELRAGRKRSHWIWYVFPQLAGLGRSATAQFYGLKDFDEARVYLWDAELGARLDAATEAVRQALVKGGGLVEVMGGTTDALKVVSSLTLFEEAAKEAGRGEFAERCSEVLAAAERQGFGRCGFTLKKMARGKAGEGDESV